MTTLDDIIELIEDAMYRASIEDDVDLLTDYSGRGMYGRTCPAVVTDSETFHRLLVGIAFACAEQGRTIDDASQFANAHTDSMGRDTVYYWPYLTN